jgi:hypothetical protein
MLHIDLRCPAGMLPLNKTGAQSTTVQPEEVHPSLLLVGLCKSSVMRSVQQPAKRGFGNFVSLNEIIIAVNSQRILPIGEDSMPVDVFRAETLPSPPE